MARVRAYICVGVCVCVCVCVFQDSSAPSLFKTQQMQRDIQELRSAVQQRDALIAGKEGGRGLQGIKARREEINRFTDERGGREAELLLLSSHKRRNAFLQKHTWRDVELDTRECSACNPCPRPR